MFPVVSTAFGNLDPMYDARQRIVGGCHTISEVLDEVPGINGFAIFVDEKVCVCVCW